MIDSLLKMEGARTDLAIDGHEAITRVAQAEAQAMADVRSGALKK